MVFRELIAQSDNDALRLREKWAESSGRLAYLGLFRWNWSAPRLAASANCRRSAVTVYGGQPRGAALLDAPGIGSRRARLRLDSHIETNRRDGGRLGVSLPESRIYAAI